MPTATATDTWHQAMTTLQQGFSGCIGCSATRLSDGFSLSMLGHDPFPAASVVKLPLLIAALQAVESGKLQLQTRYVVESADQVGGSGLLQGFEPGLAVTLQDLLTMMIIVSDNTATNMVLKLLGGPTMVNTSFQRLNLQRLRMYGELMAPVGRKTSAQRQDILATTTAHEMNQLLQRLYNGELLSQQLKGLALSILAKQHYQEMLKRYLPSDAVVHSKSGQIIGVRCDVGLIDYQGMVYSIAVLSQGCQDQRYHVDNEGVLAVAEVSRLVFRCLQAQRP
jgi:beta-lactamase class A